MLYLCISVGTNSVWSSVVGFFRDAREVRSSVLQTKLDVWIVRCLDSSEFGCQENLFLRLAGCEIKNFSTFRT